MRTRAARRRPFTAVLVLSVAVAGLVALGPSVWGVGGRGESRDKSAGEAPNILIFITDDQRADSMGAMPKTSRYFKDEGRWFPNAFSTTPVCCPARASIFTGRFVHNHGVTHFEPYELAQTTTLQAALQRNGYRTAFYGKYLNGYSRRDDPPFFDDWAFYPQATAASYGGGRYNINGRIKRISRYSTDFLRDRVFRFVQQREAEGDARPWLMYVSSAAPHRPFVPAPRHADAPAGRWDGNEAVFEGDLSDKPAHVRWPARGTCDLACGQATRRQQFRSLMAVDDMIDEIMRKLEDVGEADETLAFFVSDNGLMWGEHGLANKRFPYLPSIKVPFGVRWPGRIQPGTDRRYVALTDIAPTALDAAGVAARGRGADGRSLLRRWTRREILIEHWAAATVPSYASLVTPGFQYVEYYVDESGDVFMREYFDLRRDPWQLDNLLALPGDPRAPSARRLADLSARLTTLRRCEGPDCP